MPFLQYAHLRARKKVAGGGGHMVFSLGPGLTDPVPVHLAALNATYPAMRFGTGDVTTIHEDSGRVDAQFTQ